MTTARLTAAVALLAAWPSIAWAQHEHHAPTPAPAPAAPATPGPPPASTPSPGSVPALTDADRAAAFPDAGGHPPHGESIYGYVLFDRLEWQSGRGGAGLAWDTKGWVGGDRDRFWFRTEGEREGGRLAEGDAHLL